MAQDERKIEASDRSDAGAAYVSRQEAAPLTNPAPTHRERMYRMVFSSSAHFPGERRHQMPNIKICPVRHKKVLHVPEDPLLETQKQRNEKLDREMLRKCDLFHVLSPPKLPPGRRLF